MTNNETTIINDSENIKLRINEKEKLEINESILGESKISCIINGNLL